MRCFLFLLSSLILVSCNKRPLEPSAFDNRDSIVKKDVLPQFINPGKSYTISVRIEPGDGELQFVSVILNIYRTGEATPLLTYAMYDDGGATSPGNGDLIAHDRIFTVTFVWQSTLTSDQQFVFEFIAEDDDGNKTAPLKELVISRANLPPIIQEVIAPDSVLSGFVGLLGFQISAIDSNGLDDVSRAFYRAVQENTEVFRGELNADAPGRFSVSIDRTFAVGKKGAYRFYFWVMDKSGVYSAEVVKDIFIENLSPVVSEISAPATVLLPSTGQQSYLITAQVLDGQGLGDISTVLLEAYYPDGSAFNNSPFTMFDNGLPVKENFEGWDQGYRGDRVANDGIYSITIFFESEKPVGEYVLSFYARDKVGNLSAKVRRTINLAK